MVHDLAVFLLAMTKFRKDKKHPSLTSDASLVVIAFRMNHIKDGADIFSILCLNLFPFPFLDF